VRPPIYVCLATLLFAGCRGAEEPDEGPQRPRPVVCEPARAGPIADVVTLRGVVDAPPDRHAAVAPAVAGRILEVRVREGDPVAVGALVAVVDAAPLQSAAEEAEAVVASAEAGAAVADAAMARARRLLAAGIAARRDAEDAEARAAAAAAELRAARARRDVATGQVDRARVRAPIAGTVIRVLRRAGELVDGTPATPVVEIADAAVLELSATAPAADLARLAAGDRAEIRLDALPGEAVPGRVVALSPAVDPATSLGSARVALQPPASVHALIGLAGQARIRLAERQGVLVPAAAVRRGARGQTEIVVCKGEGEKARAQVREVKLGARAADSVAVLDGLAAGEQVAATNVLGLEDGAPIAPIAPAGAAGSPP
jgi:RND family efflux transporter MFP subunit